MRNKHQVEWLDFLLIYLQPPCNTYNSEGLPIM